MGTTKAIRTALKAIEPDTRVTAFSDGDFMITVHHKVDEVAAALPALGLKVDRRDVADHIGTRWDWWITLWVSPIATRASEASE